VQSAFGFVFVAAMKYFFIVDDSGNAIYFNHPFGTMIALPFALAQTYVKENFGDSFAAIDCADGTKLAFDTVRFQSFSRMRSIWI
jgi:hypothetical protein